MTSYSKGRRLEYAARDRLIALGYYVIRSAGSKGLADLVALGPSDTILVQVKKKGSEYDKEKLDKLRRLQVQEGVRKELWIRIPYRGWSIKDLADHRDQRLDKTALLEDSE